MIVYRPGRPGQRWRWWQWANYYGRRHPLHTRPHIGRRRARRVRYTIYAGDYDAWTSHNLQSAAGRRMALQRPAYELHVETVPAGPYEEQYAGWRASWWWQRRIMASRERRGWPRVLLLIRLYRAHPLQGGRS